MAHNHIGEEGSQIWSWLIFVGNRFMGTESERKAQDYILNLFEAYGLESPHEETYRYFGWKRGPCKVEMVSPTNPQDQDRGRPHDLRLS